MTIAGNYGHTGPTEQSERSYVRALPLLSWRTVGPVTELSFTGYCVLTNYYLGLKTTFRMEN